MALALPLKNRRAKMKRMPMNRKENEQEGRNRGRKTFGLFCILTSFLFLFSGTAKADWVKGEGKNAWWFDFGNGDYFKSSWQWIDGNQDGIAECYCFDKMVGCMKIPLPLTDIL